MSLNKIIFLAIVLVGCSDSAEESAKYANERALSAEYNRHLGQEYAEELEEKENDEYALIITQQTFMGRPCAATGRTPGHPCLA